MEKNIIFVVQHMQEYLFNWCKWQYLKMLQYIEGNSITLCFTNCRLFNNYQGEKLEENKINIQEVKAGFQKYNNKGILIDQPFAELVSQNTLDLKALGQFSRNSVCLLDLRAEKALATGDTTTTQVFVFGGILGDHPPRDRTKTLRTDIETMRHLGKPQLSTDTAVLVSKLILKNNFQLQTIPFVEQPQIKGLNRDKKKTVIQMQGFRYVDQVLDWKNGQLTDKPKGQVYMHDEIRRILLQDELDVAAFM